MSLFSFRANACMHACMNAYIHACMPAFLPQLSRVLFSYVFVHPIPCQFPIYRSILHRKIPLRVNSTLYFLIDLFDENIYIYIIVLIVVEFYYLFSLFLSFSVEKYSGNWRSYLAKLMKDESQTLYGDILIEFLKIRIKGDVISPKLCIILPDNNNKFNDPEVRFAMKFAPFHPRGWSKPFFPPLTVFKPFVSLRRNATRGIVALASTLRNN